MRALAKTVDTFERQTFVGAQQVVELPLRFQLVTAERFLIFQGAQSLYTEFFCASWVLNLYSVVVKVAQMDEHVE